MTSSIYRLRMPLILWFTVTFFFAFQFILRLSVGILREDILQKFSVSTIDFGHLAGFYYLGYAGMQIPIGFMLDRYNFRIVTFIAIASTALGTLLFSSAESWNLILFARFLIGAGSAVAFLSIAKVTKTFFPERMHSIMLGFAFTVGLSGAVVGGKPIKIIFENFGYDATLKMLSLGALLIGFLVILINDRKIDKVQSHKEDTISIRQTFKLILSPTILLIGIFGGLMVGSLEGFADVWAIPFFSHIYHYSEHDSIFAASILYIGMCVGGPVLAFFARKFNSSILMIILTGVFTSILFLILFSNERMNYISIVSLMFFLGIFCCYQVLVFTLAAQLVSKSCAGLAIAIINCINMSFGHFFHVIISNIIQNNWAGVVNDRGNQIYDMSTYVMGLATIPIFCLVGTAGFAFLSYRQKKGKLKIVDL